MASTVAQAAKANRPHGLFAFADRLADGQSLEDALPKNADPDKLMDHPEFAVALVAALHRKIATRLAPKALKTLDSLLDSTDERVKHAASQTVLKYAVPPLRTDAEAAKGKELESMSVTELSELVGQLEGELAGRAKDVTPADSATVDATQSAKPFDFME